MTLKHWPVEERPRERMKLKGVEALSDAELLALIIGKGIKGVNAIELARRWLKQSGGLALLLQADYKTLRDEYGIGQATCCQLLSILECHRRYFQEQLKRKKTFLNSKDVATYLIAQLGSHDHEVFACLYLDTRHRFIHFEKLFRGTLHRASVHPREVVKRALYHNAAALIVGHNHPSGNAQPSQIDCEVTQQLKESLLLVEVRLLDHVIVGDRWSTSFAENGWL